MVAPGFIQIAEASIREVSVRDARTPKITRAGAGLLLEELQKKPAGQLFEIDSGDLTKLALYFSRNFRHQICELVLSDGETRINTGEISHELLLLNLLLLAKIYQKTGFCTALARKLDDGHLIIQQRYDPQRDEGLFSSESEQAVFNQALRTVQGPAKPLMHDIIIDYGALDEEKLGLFKAEISKGVLRIARISRENYRFVAKICVEGRDYWATEINLLEQDPIKILNIAMELLNREISTAHPVAIIEHNGRVYYITEDVKNAVTLANALKDPAIPEETKNSILIETGRFLRIAEEKGISITDPNMTNIMVNAKCGIGLTLIDIAEVIIHDEGIRGKTNMRALLEYLSDSDKALVMQGYGKILSIIH